MSGAWPPSGQGSGGARGPVCPAPPDKTVTGTPGSRFRCIPGIPGSGSVQSYAYRTGHRTSARPSVGGRPPPKIVPAHRLWAVVVPPPPLRDRNHPGGQLASRAVPATARPMALTSTGTSCGSSAASFATPSTRSLPGIPQCAGTHWAWIWR